MPLRLLAPTADDTRAIGAALAPLLGPGDGVALTGELGAGKTTLVQGVARALGYRGAVTSPTFTLVREYRTERLLVVHVDVYRLDRVQDVVDLGLQELIDEDGVLFVEWGDAVEALLPPEHLVVELRAADPDGLGETRSIRLHGVGASWATRWERLEHELERWTAEPGS
jgi:tRNA threonylcarbamoyladenosine biosynthesis protein TsaE